MTDNSKQSYDTPSNQDTNRDKVLRREVVKVSDGRLREMQAQAISFEGVGDYEYHWHWAAVVNELIALRAHETQPVASNHMSLPKELRVIADTIETNGGWHIAALKVREAASLLETTPVETSPDEGFQARVHDWMAQCFIRSDAMLPAQRSFRFIEEALELVQASGTSQGDVLRLVDYVYSRPVGAMDQEIGGVVVTLAGLANSVGLSVEYAGNAELARCVENTEKIRAKDLAKPQRSPLPGSSVEPSPALCPNGHPAKPIDLDVRKCATCGWIGYVKASDYPKPPHLDTCASKYGNTYCDCGAQKATAKPFCEVTRGCWLAPGHDGHCD